MESSSPSEKLSILLHDNSDKMNYFKKNFQNRIGIFVKFVSIVFMRWKNSFQFKNCCHEGCECCERPDCSCESYDHGFDPASISHFKQKCSSRTAASASNNQPSRKHKRETRREGEKRKRKKIFGADGFGRGGEA